jgi:hypothetical protein
MKLQLIVPIIARNHQNLDNPLLVLPLPFINLEENPADPLVKCNTFLYNVIKDFNPKFIRATPSILKYDDRWGYYAYLSCLLPYEVKLLGDYRWFKLKDLIKTEDEDVKKLITEFGAGNV